MGLICSLVKSLIASAIGCGRPINLGLFGPFRSWAYARNFRSTKVKNAIVIKSATERIMVLASALYIGW